MPKQLTMPDFLTKQQIDKCIALFKLHNDKSVHYIKQQVIEPNMAAIDSKIGQKNDATYLSYAVYYILTQCPTLELIQ